MRVHFIAVGGSAMHNLAIALHLKGFQVTGSDDEIFEPSKSRLRKHELLPEVRGWNPERITTDLDAVILGMHARNDNPELLKAQELGVTIYSYPEYLYEQTKNKKRVVIGGSHGKTTTTAMVMHVLQELQLDFDYMVGAQLDGFETMVKLTKDAPIRITSYNVCYTKLLRYLLLRSFLRIIDKLYRKLLMFHAHCDRLSGYQYFYI